MQSPLDQQTSHRSSSPSAAAAAGPASEFLTFRLGAESYGIEILKVQEG